MGFMLRAEGVASPEPPDQFVHELVATANRLQVAIICRLNGTDVFAMPGESTATVYNRWREVFEHYRRMEKDARSRT